jgi:antitoxin VapB
MEGTMLDLVRKPRTRVFKSGNSLAVRLPKEIAFEDNTEVEIERKGDTVMIRPVVRKKLTGIADTFSKFSNSFMAQGREFHEEQERDWGRKK